MASIKASHESANSQQGATSEDGRPSSAFDLSEATEVDIESIAAVHMATFGSNALLLAQFPTPVIREGFKRCVADKVAADIRDSKVAVLVVRDQDEVISFAIWHLPVQSSEGYVEAPWPRWPDGSDLQLLNEYAEKVDAAHTRILGDVPCYRLSFIGTLPSYQRRGAASLLLQWCLQRRTTENTPVYLESTTDAGPLYEKHGFKPVDSISMVLGGRQKGDAPIEYVETCYLFN